MTIHSGGPRAPISVTESSHSYCQGATVTSSKSGRLPPGSPISLSFRAPNFGSGIASVAAIDARLGFLADAENEQEGQAWGFLGKEKVDFRDMDWIVGLVGEGWPWFGGGLLDTPRDALVFAGEPW